MVQLKLCRKQKDRKLLAPCTRFNKSKSLTWIEKKKNTNIWTMQLTEAICFYWIWYKAGIQTCTLPAILIPFSSTFFLPCGLYCREGKLWKAFELMAWNYPFIYTIYKRNWTWRPEFRLVPRSVQFLLVKKESLKKRESLLLRSVPWNRSWMPGTKSQEFSVFLFLADL